MRDDMRKVEWYKDSFYYQCLGEHSILKGINYNTMSASTLDEDSASVKPNRNPKTAICAAEKVGRYTDNAIDATPGLSTERAILADLDIAAINTGLVLTKSPNTYLKEGSNRQTKPKPASLKTSGLGVMAGMKTTMAKARMIYGECFMTMKMWGWENRCAHAVMH